MKKVGIIGAGLSGLVTAWFIKHFNPSIEVTIFEGEKKGGLISSEVIEDIRVQTGPDLFPLENPVLSYIADKLGEKNFKQVKDYKVHVLKDTYYQKAPSGFMDFENGLYSFLSGGFAAMLGLKKKVSVWENLSFFDVLKSTYGQTYAETFGSVFARTNFFCEAEDLNFYAAYRPLYNQLKKGLNLKDSILACTKENKEFWDSELEGQKSFKPGFYYYEGGLDQFIEAIYNNLKQNGVHFEFSKISEISSHKNEYVIHSKSHRFDGFTNIFISASAEDQVHLWKQISKDISVKLSELKYRPVSYVYSAYPMKSFNRADLGFFAPRKEKLTITGSYYVNSYNEEVENKDLFLTRTVIAGDLSLFNNEELIDLQKKDFEKVFSLSSDPAWSRVYRQNKGMPNLDKNYMLWKKDVLGMVEDFPGIRLIGNDFNSGNVNEVLKDSYITAKDLCKQI